MDPSHSFSLRHARVDELSYQLSVKLHEGVLTMGNDWVTKIVDARRSK